MKESKQIYYTKLFENNCNNIKNPWKGDIFNMSFSTGQFPSVLKIAKVMPIHKNNQKLIIQIIDQYASYLIFFWNEKFIYKRLSNFLDINNLIYSLQFDFWRKYSNTHALINLTESIRQTL